MADWSYDDAYFGQLQRRLRSLLGSFQDRLPQPERAMVDELIDANESGVELETFVEFLAKGSVLLDRSELQEMVGLARTMGMASEVTDRLRPLSVA